MGTAAYGPLSQTFVSGHLSGYMHHDGACDLEESKIQADEGNVGILRISSIRTGDTVSIEATISIRFDTEWNQEGYRLL
jgi:hypothetical protein